MPVLTICAVSEDHVVINFDDWLLTAHRPNLYGFCLWCHEWHYCVLIRYQISEKRSLKDVLITM